MTASVSTLRPTTPRDEPPDGFHYEVVEQDDWTTTPVGAGRCRYMVEGRRACGATPVASLFRVHHSRSGRRPVPWDYCADHLYSRWIENDKVVGWRLAKNQ